MKMHEDQFDYVSDKTIDKIAEDLRTEDQILIQTIRFKNDLNGNPKQIMLKYKLPKDRTTINWLYPEEVIEIGYERPESHINKGDYVLSTIYAWLPYSKMLRQFK